MFPTDKTDSKLESAGLSMTWPKTGGWEGGELFELPTLAQAIAANGCFFSPLDWQSPGANLGSAGCAGQVPSAKAGNACLHTDAINWPTASARDHKGVNQRLAARGTLDQLPNAAEQWPTCHGIGGQNGATASEIGQSDSKFPPSHQPETPTPNGSAYSDLIQLLCQLYHVTSEAEFRAAKKSLNPRFAAWLMGWPADWAFVPTNFAASAMASSGNVLQQHTTNSPGGCLGVGDMQANVIDQGVHDSPVLAGGAA